MEAAPSFRITPRLILGLGIFAFGVLWTLDNLDYIEADRYLDYWPVILIAIGLIRLLDPTSGRVGSVVLIAVGTWLLLESLDLIDWDLGDLIPVLVALLGIKLIYEASTRRQRRSESDPNSSISAFAMMAGVRRQSTSREFVGGDATAIMGGVELDLTNAIPKDGEAVIDTFAMMGGVEITVPENWTVVGRVLPLMGGFEDKTRPPKEPGPRLIVKGTAIMGAVEVKNSRHASDTR